MSDLLTTVVLSVVVDLLTKITGTNYMSFFSHAGVEIPCFTHKVRWTCFHTLTVLFMDNPDLSWHGQIFHHSVPI